MNGVTASLATYRMRLELIGQALGLLDCPVWILFRLSRKDTCRLDKKPLIPGTTIRASISDPTTWRSFEVAFADAVRRGYYDGGIVGDAIPVGAVLGYRVGVAITREQNITVVDE